MPTSSGEPVSSLTDRVVRASGTTLHLPARELDRLHDHAAGGFPHEVVGILAGDRAAGSVDRVVPLENATADTPERRYHVSGLTLMKAERALDAEGLEVVGYYHSHPHHPAMYSDTDRDQALPAMSYVIAAVSGPDTAPGGAGPQVGELRSWRLADDRSEMLEEHVVITPDSPAPSA